MSLDKSLKSGSSLRRHRNVLTRPERIAKLKEIGKWEEGTSPYGLPKVINRKATVGKKEKVQKTEEAAAEGDATVTEESK